MAIEQSPEFGVWTDSAGKVLDITPAAARLLGIGPRAMRGRAMHLFVTAKRGPVLDAVERAARGHDDTLTVELQPRDRRDVPVTLHLQHSGYQAMQAVVRWVITPIDRPSG